MKVKTQKIMQKSMNCKILPLVHEYVFSLMHCISHNLEPFQANSIVSHVNTVKNDDLHITIARFNILRKAHTPMA
jgi:hypothetical protein